MIGHSYHLISTRNCSKLKGTCYNSPLFRTFSNCLPYKMSCWCDFSRLFLPSEMTRSLQLLPLHKNHYEAIKIPNFFREFRPILILAHHWRLRPQARSARLEPPTPSPPVNKALWPCEQCSWKL